MASDIEEFKARLEEWSEDHIRYLLATGKIKKREKVALAEEALRRKEQAREEELERRHQASIQNQIAIARSAKNGTWVAAFAAVVAALCAAVAISYQLAPL